MVRIVLGCIFFVHGYQKVVTAGLARVTRYFAGEGFPIPEAFAFVSSYLELLGGVALVIGLRTRGVAFLFCIQMLVALIVIEVWARFIVHVELPLMLLGLSFVILILGAGPWSVDSLLKRS